MRLRNPFLSYADPNLKNQAESLVGASRVVSEWVVEGVYIESLKALILRTKGVLTDLLNLGKMRKDSIKHIIGH
jgi:hypothetical protein